MSPSKPDDMGLMILLQPNKVVLFDSAGGHQDFSAGVRGKQC